MYYDFICKDSHALNLDKNRNLGQSPTWVHPVP